MLHWIVSLDVLGVRQSRIIKSSLNLARYKLCSVYIILLCWPVHFQSAKGNGQSTTDRAVYFLQNRLTSLGPEVARCVSKVRG